MINVSEKTFRDIEKKVGKDKMSKIEKNSSKSSAQEIVPVQAIRKMNSPEQTTAEIIKLHKGINDLMIKGLEDALKIGDLLIILKDIIRGKGGLFTEWVKENMPFSIRTAQRYMELSPCKDEFIKKNIKTLNDAYAHIKGEPITDEIIDADDSLNIKDDITIKSTGDLDTMELPKKKAKGIQRKFPLSKPEIDSMINGEGYEGCEERYTKFVVELRKGNIHNKHIGEFVCAAEKYLKPGGKIIFHKR